ncbi:tyrosine-type recombinase/integrase [Streptomyces lavendulae]|uniref:tyrosine-type recombinase/integrase n=1 Tax=Streptomyces lavendulae TaxID=1914 RepID=UPI0037F34EC3
MWRLFAFLAAEGTGWCEFRGPDALRLLAFLRRAPSREAVSRYLMHERPLDASSPFVFLAGGKGTRRLEPPGYDAVVRLFARRLDKPGLRTPETTPHALRHTHATARWEGGMRELSLQKRLAHASPESTKVYTRVSDEAVLADYTRALESNR